MELSVSVDARTGTATQHLPSTKKMRFSEQTKHSLSALFSNNELNRS